jgi:hypothetical protein
MSGVQNFDPGLIITTIGAYPVTDGYAPGTFVKAARTKPTFTPQVGSQGTVARVRSRDKTGTIEITVMRTAAVNDYLTALAARDEDFGTGIVPITIRDLNGKTKVFGAECWLQKQADVEEANEPKERTWTFDVASLEMNVGGNAS